MDKYVIGIDLGGTKVEACLMNTKRTIITRKRTLANAHLGLDEVIKNINKIVEEAAEGTKFDAIGIGTPGTYIAQDDKLYGAPNSIVYETPGFIQRIRNQFKVPVIVENDANCLALAEFFASCESKYRFVLAVIMGTGFGTGLILDNKLYRGARGGAGEIGHTSIDLNGRICGCGRKGCIEAYLSGTSISRRYFDLSGNHLDVPQIYQLYLSKEPNAIVLFEESIHILGEALANVVNAFDLEAIIMGGGVSNLPIWYEENTVSCYMKNSFFGVPRGEVPLIPAKLGDSAGVAGAAYLALRELGFMNF